MSAEILNLDKDQLKFVLKNYDCFSSNEVKIAAKRLAQWKDKPVNLAELQQLRQGDHYQRSLQYARDLQPTRTIWG